MDRKRLRVIVLAVLLAAAGAYFWMQQSAGAVKPAQTATVAKKPVPTPAAKKPGTAAPSAANTPAPSSVPAGARTAPAPGPKPTLPPPATNSAAVVPPPAAPKSMPAPAVDAKTASNAPARTAPVVPAAAPVVTTPAVPAIAVEPAAWQDHLRKGSYLAEKLSARLPDGTDLVAASAGFRDLQHFVATVSASHHLKLNFDELKRRVLTDRKGLASAIDAMKKVSSATIEEQRAEYEARGLIQEAKRHPLPPAPVAKAVPVKSQPQPKKPLRARSGL